MQYLEADVIYRAKSEHKMLEIEPSSVALSLWSPPYFVGKEYKKETFESWQAMLQKVIENHALALKSGGFLLINIADILCFKDDDVPRIQASCTFLDRKILGTRLVAFEQSHQPSVVGSYCLSLAQLPQTSPFAV